MAATLRVRARGTALVLDHAAVSAGIRRYIGRKYDESLPGFVPVDAVVEVPLCKEYADDIRDGSLWAADEETAKAVWGDAWKSHFDPSFGDAPHADTEKS